MAALSAERPVPVPPVVVRHGREERDDRGAEVVQPRPLEQRRVDGEVDDVAAAADDTELPELDPVVRRAERAENALHRFYAASCDTISSVPSAATDTSSRSRTSSRSDRARAR